MVNKYPVDIFHKGEFYETNKIFGCIGNFGVSKLVVFMWGIQGVAYKTGAGKYC
jgi:hypothetical protein